MTLAELSLLSDEQLKAHIIEINHKKNIKPKICGGNGCDESLDVQIANFKKFAQRNEDCSKD